MRPVDTDALGQIAKVLGIGNPATATSPVDFDDAVLQQVVDVLPTVRRARTIPGTGGLFHGQVSQVHAGAGSLLSQVDPYELSATSLTAEGGYPDPVPDDFDVWLLGAVGSAAVGVINTNLFSNCLINLPNTGSAFGSSGGTIPYFMGDTEAPISAAVAFIANSASPDMRQPAFRLTRGTVLDLNSHAGAAGTVFWTIFLGLFPAGLGQDLLG